MKSASDTCFIIQARLGSQRIPQKMIRPFGGSTLTDIAIRKILASSVIPKEDFYLAVHEPSLIAIGEKYGVNIFKRSKMSAEAESDLKQIYEWHDKLPYTYAVKINACAPLLSIETIDSFVVAYLESEHDGLFGVLKTKDYYWNAKGAMITLWPEGLTIMNTKAVGLTYRAAHCLYAGRLDLIKRDIWMGTFQRANDPALFILGELESFDIDYDWQFEMAEGYYLKKKCLQSNGTR